MFKYQKTNTKKKFIKKKFNYILKIKNILSLYFISILYAVYQHKSKTHKIFFFVKHTKDRETQTEKLAFSGGPVNLKWITGNHNTRFGYEFGFSYECGLFSNDTFLSECLLQFKFNKNNLNFSK